MATGGDLEHALYYVNWLSSMANSISPPPHALYNQEGVNLAEKVTSQKEIHQLRVVPRYLNNTDHDLECVKGQLKYHRQAPQVIRHIELVQDMLREASLMLGQSELAHLYPHDYRGRLLVAATDDVRIQFEKEMRKKVLWDSLILISAYMKIDPRTTREIFMATHDFVSLMGLIVKEHRLTERQFGILGRFLDNCHQIFTEEQLSVLERYLHRAASSLQIVLPESALEVEPKVGYDMYKLRGNFVDKIGDLKEKKEEEEEERKSNEDSCEGEVGLKEPLEHNGESEEKSEVEQTEKRETESNQSEGKEERKSEGKPTWRVKSSQDSEEEGSQQDVAASDQNGHSSSKNGTEGDEEDDEEEKKSRERNDKDEKKSEYREKKTR